MNEPLLKMATDIVAAHVGHNAIEPDAVPAFIESVYTKISSLNGTTPVATASLETGPKVKPTPAVPVSESVFNDYLICLYDGSKKKMLKRYIMTKFGKTVDEYRADFDLPAEYPMVSPEYAKRRSNLAIKAGLGKGGRSRAAEAETADGTEASVSAKPVVRKAKKIVPMKKPAKKAKR